MKLLAALVLVQLTAQPLGPMDRAGKMAEIFWDQFTAVESVERISQARLKDDGKIVSSRITEFDYVALLRPRDSAVAVEESRVPRARVAADPSNEFLLTSGFPALLLLFHPDYREKFDFQESPAAGDPPGSVRIAFKSKHGERSLSAVKFNGRFYPIFWRGFAWIDKGTGAVTRIDVSLDEPMEDIGLSSLRAEIDYGAVALPNIERSYHLPERVTVTVRTPKQQWRNVHEFSQYKLFTVTTVTHGESERGQQ